MIFFSALLAVFFGALLMFCLHLRGPRHNALVSSYNVVIGLFGLYMLLPAIMLIAFNGGNYVWIPQIGGAEGIAITLMACIFGASVFTFGYLIPIPRNRLRFREWHLCGKNSKITAWVFIIIGVVLKIYVLFLSGGMETGILRLSSGIRENLDVESLTSLSIVIRYLSGIADAGATWLLLDRMRSRERLLPILMVFVGVVGLTFFSVGKRLFLLWPIFVAVLGTHYYIRPIRISNLPVIGLLLLGFGFLSLMFRIYMPAFVAGIDIDLNSVAWADGSLLKFYFFSLEFASFEVLEFALRYSDSVTAVFGTSLEAFYVTNIQPLAYFIPRLFWPEKPVLFFDLSHAYRTLIMGGTLDSGGGIAATILGTSWTLGGPLGFTIVMFFFGLFCRVLDNNPNLRYRPSPQSLCWYAFWLVVVFHLFRQGTLAWTIIIVLIQQAGLIVGFLVLGAVESRLSRRIRRRQQAVSPLARASGDLLNGL